VSAARWWRARRRHDRGPAESRHPESTLAAREAAERGSGAGTEEPGSERLAAQTAAACQPHALDSGEIMLYRVARAAPDVPDRYLGICCGDIRRARCADVWVNSENTDMQMARWNEFSVSSIIRFEGAERDETGRVVHDLIADELTRRVAGRVPVPPGTAITTGAGELTRFGVRRVVHVAAVQGEPGAGFRQVREVGRCVAGALAEVDRIDARLAPASVLFPLLGVGHGGGDLRSTIASMAGAAIDHLAGTPSSPVSVVYLLAYTDLELAACVRVLATHPRLEAVDPGQTASIVQKLAPHELAGSMPAVSTAARPETEPERLPGPGPVQGSRALRMGFVIDVVGYGGRSAPAQEAVQVRLFRLVEEMLARCGTSLDGVEREWTGDGVNIILSGSTDPTTALSGLVRTAANRLAADNRDHDDRMRLRMAVGIGIVGPGPTGFAGSMIIDINRMVDSGPLRAALNEHPDADLAVMLSDYLHEQVVRPGYPGLRTDDLHAVDVAVKEFRRRAWLWIVHQDTAGHD
jgi:hypothetical protein